MNSRKFYPLILLIMIVSIFGCSGGPNSPLLPPDEGQPPVIEPVQPDTGSREAGDVNAGSHQLWGYYMISVSADRQDVEVIPMRDIEQHMNVLSYLEVAPCTTCVKILSKTPVGGGVFDFGVQLRHPFAGQNLYTGFDVRGIAIFKADGSFPTHDLRYSTAETGNGEVLNPDGYTHLYHVATQGSGLNGLQGYKKGAMAGPIAPNGTLNAYKNYYSSDNRHFMLAGSAIEKTYRVDMPNGAFIFGYAVDANWAIPLPNPPVNIPEDFGLNANSPEAYQISATVNEGLDTDGGSAVVDIWVYDWQGMSTIKSVNLEAPDLFGATVDATFDGIASDYVKYKATIANTLGAVAGDYDMLVSVEDTANDLAPYFLDLTAYQIINAPVVQGIPNQPPVAVAEADKTNVMTGEQIFFDGTGSYDPDGDAIALYTWDFDGDGQYDDAFQSSTYWSYDTPGNYNVDLEVWDPFNATDNLNTKIQIQVQADPCDGHKPICNAIVDNNKPNVGVSIKFTDVSTDPDGFGDLAFYEWDFEGLAQPYTPNYLPGSKETMQIYYVGGDYYTYHRVTDNSNCTDELNAPMLIEVNGPPLADAEADVYEITVGGQVTFTSLATDPDGNGPINKWEWDLNNINNDGPGGDGYESTGPVTVKQYFGAATYHIRHRVTDSKGLSDELDTDMTIIVDPMPDVVIHLSEEHAMNPDGAKYIFFNYFGSIGGTGMINYLDIDGPWDFTTLGSNGVFNQNIVAKTDGAVSGWNSNWPSVGYYVYQKGPSSLSGATTQAYAAMKRDYTSPPDDGDQYTYGIVDLSSGTEFIKFNPWNIMTWPLDKTTNQYDAFTYTALTIDVNCQVWLTTLGQGTVIIDVAGVPTPFQALLLKQRQRDVWESDFGQIVLGDTVVYRWMADDGTELAAVTGMNAYMNPDNWNVGSGLITGSGCIRWLDSYDLGG